LKKVYDKDVVFRDIHRYDPDWVAINKEHAQQKVAELPEHGNLSVTLVNARKRHKDDGLDENEKIDNN
jgi:hypothetical protein